jgi:PAS domain-containing protein
MERLDRRARKHEDASYAKYLDRIGQVNLIDGTSASITGIEASTVVGRSPVAVIELHKGMLSLITSNIAFNRLVERIGAESFDALARENTTAAANIVARVSSAARSARDLGMPQLVDFVAHGVFCSATMVFVAQTDDREAYLTTVTSVEGAPTVTEHSLLMGLLETSRLCFFWKDTKRRFLGANKNFLNYYGFSDLGAILGKTDEDMGWHVHDDPFREDELAVLQGEEVRMRPGVCRRKGELRRILANKLPLRSGGRIVGLVGYFTDQGPYLEDES